jgi:hypothetical protein
VAAVWSALKRAAGWLRDHWYVPLFALGVVLGFLISGKVRRKGPPPAQVKAELEAITAGAEASKMAAAVGKAEAVRVVEETHSEAVEALDEKEREEADKLREDPRALARYLVRAGRRRRPGG